MLEHGVVRYDGGCEVDARTWGCEVRDGAGTWRGVRWMLEHPYDLIKGLMRSCWNIGGVKCEVDAGT